MQTGIATPTESDGRQDWSIFGSMSEVDEAGPGRPTYRRPWCREWSAARHAAPRGDMPRPARLSWKATISSAVSASGTGHSEPTAVDAPATRNAVESVTASSYARPARCVVHAASETTPAEASAARPAAPFRISSADTVAPSASNRNDDAAGPSVLQQCRDRFGHQVDRGRDRRARVRRRHRGPTGRRRTSQASRPPARAPRPRRPEPSAEPGGRRSRPGRGHPARPVGTAERSPGHAGANTDASWATAGTIRLPTSGRLTPGLANASPITRATRSIGFYRQTIRRPNGTQ
jgi:hypothetical protein